ncbi:FAD-dependent oxidoreductase [Candidatus Nomurabacteria bacterium]|nr:FAD-dependent oxidoreductase [Candidatus Nomurabacteria bacterium]
MYDLIILGGGPAGAAAAVYAARKQLKTALITSEFGGQSTVSTTIYNWIGTPEIGGAELGENLKKHVMYYKGEFLDVYEGQKVASLSKDNNIFTITTDTDKTYTSKTVLVTTGSGRRKLECENADKYEHRGITYCASCDGPMFAGQDVVVIGGGNAGFESAAQLLAYCKSVTLLHRSDTFKADEITVKKLLTNDKFKAIKNVEILRVDGTDVPEGEISFVSLITYRDKISGSETTLPTTGIFVETGQTPNTGFLKGVVPLNEIGKVIVDPMTQKTQLEGVWAAGDATNGIYHQNNIACGDAVKALEDIYIWIQKNS